jgi:NAD(P)H-hydrate repair Nnr-like enzyme with NAD(P)H-hydrate dehydratase domain
MPWLLFALALTALAVAFKTTSVALLVACLILGLGLGLAGVMQLLARRVESRSRDEGLMLDPDELRRLREQAEARKRAAANTDTAH